VLTNRVLVEPVSVTNTAARTARRQDHRTAVPAVTMTARPVGTMARNDGMTEATTLRILAWLSAIAMAWAAGKTAGIIWSFLRR
jgi:hypothetical protein